MCSRSSGSPRRRLTPALSKNTKQKKCGRTFVVRRKRTPNLRNRLIRRAANRKLRPKSIFRTFPVRETCCEPSRNRRKRWNLRRNQRGRWRRRQRGLQPRRWRPSLLLPQPPQNLSGHLHPSPPLLHPLRKNPPLRCSRQSARLRQPIGPLRLRLRRWHRFLLRRAQFHPFHRQLRRCRLRRRLRRSRLRPRRQLRRRARLHLRLPRRRPLRHHA
jgi:hypothetical protein